MGGRGASSGKSDKGNPYGSQYHSLFSEDNIKFVTKNSRLSETLMETMTPGRVYVETGGDDLLRVVFFDNSNRRNKVLERDKRTGEWHVHEGYFHNEYGKDEHGNLSAADQAMIDKVETLWQNKQRNIV